MHNVVPTISCWNDDVLIPNFPLFASSYNILTNLEHITSFNFVPNIPILPNIMD